MFREFGGWPPLEVYFEQRRGCECGGHGMMFVSLARAAGVPARRFLQPLLEPAGAEGRFKFSSHMSGEFLDDELGWVPLDCTGSPILWGCYPLSGRADRLRHVHVHSVPPELGKGAWRRALEAARGAAVDAEVDLYDASMLVERMPLDSQ